MVLMRQPQLVQHLQPAPCVLDGLQVDHLVQSKLSLSALNVRLTRDVVTNDVVEYLGSENGSGIGWYLEYVR